MISVTKGPVANRRIIILIWVLVSAVVSLSSCQKDEGLQLFNNGLALWEVEKYDEAVQDFITLTKAYPEHPLVDDALFWIASVYEHYLNDLEEAVRYYRALNSRYEGSEYYVRSMVGLGRVRSLQGEEGKQKAIRVFRKLQTFLEDQKDKNEWYDNQLRLARLFFDLEQFEQARVELKHLMTRDESLERLAKAYYLIGRSYYLEGEIELAKLTFIEVDKRFGYNKLSLASAMNLADIYEQAGDLRSAIAVYETVLDRLERREVFYQLADERIQKLRLRLRQTNTG